ncbi:MAG: hypothetical protein K2X66_08480 [Cyanobacteria bacterium]|nr:hypothetical protein [Cyanobacteriota bacterium]
MKTNPYPPTFPPTQKHKTPWFSATAPQPYAFEPSDAQKKRLAQILSASTDVSLKIVEDVIGAKNYRDDKQLHCALFIIEHAFFPPGGKTGFKQNSDVSLNLFA